MTPQFTEDRQPDPAVVDLARRALGIALRGPLDGGMLDIAQRVVQRIASEFPQHGVWVACLAWCDTVQARVPELQNTADMADTGLAFEQADSGRRTLADDSVPPASQWAGRFLLARLRDDPDTCYALFKSHTHEGEFGASVMALLSMSALAITRGHVHIGTAKEVLSP